MEAIQIWCNDHCEGKWMYANTRISATHCTPCSEPSPIDGEKYGPAMFHKNHGYMIAFEEEGDYTKFMLSWA